MNRSLLFSGLVLVAAAGVGCGTQTSVEVPQEEAASPTVEVSTVAQIALPPADCAPEKIVEMFLEALREGNDGLASGLLTKTAREETAKHDLTVQPPGVPSATFNIGQVDFIDEQQTGAHVNSMWSEEMPDGSDVSYKIVWALRRQPDGWRVAGMATEIMPNEPPVFLNFEDPTDMLQKWQQAEAVAREQTDAIIR